MCVIILGPIVYHVLGKTAMVYTIFLGKQWKRVYTIGPERVDRAEVKVTHHPNLR